MLVVLLIKTEDKCINFTNGTKFCVYHWNRYTWTFLLEKSVLYITLLKKKKKKDGFQ